MSADGYRLVLIALELAVLAWIVLHDLRTMVVPNRYVYPAVVLSLIAILPLGLGVAGGVWLGALAAFVALLLIAIAGRGAMGMGDTKVGALCGAIVGLQGVFPMLALTFAGGGLVAGGLLVTRMRGRSEAIPLTPFMFAGVVVTLVLVRPTGL
jgi:leader peptidase (prepilin peptidase)/N-methyltransferase